MSKVRFGGILFAGASMFVLATAAQAQQASVVDEVVITGSRVIKNGDASPSPVTVVQTEEILAQRPGTLADALNVLPAFAGSRGTSGNPSTTGSQTAGNGNANQLNLRNLGVTRTLILMDGYRVPPTSFNNVVDADIIPQMLISRVDIVTGGVSAVYGSDAVAGVVNYVIDRKFNGLKLQANGGITQRSDNQRSDFGIAYGRSILDGRGHLEGSYQYIDQKGIDARSNRDWLNQWGVSGTGTAANPYVLNNNVRFPGFPFGGLITGAATAANPLGGQLFATDGVLRPFVPGATTGTAAMQVGGDGGYYDSGLTGRERANQVFGRFDYDVSDNLRVYAQVSGDLKRNRNFSDPLRLTNQRISATNAFLPAAVQAQLAAAKQATFQFAKQYGNETRLDSISDSKQWVYAVGAEGKLGEWDWGINYSRGDSQLDVELARNPNILAVSAALDAVVNPATGQIVCNITLTNPTNPYAQGCVPLNPFGPTASSPQALNYVLRSTYYNAKTIQNDVTAHIAGSPFSLPAGPVQVAFSGEWRDLSFTARSTGTPQNIVTADICAQGLRFNCTPPVFPAATNPPNPNPTPISATGIWAFSFANAPEVSNTVKEGAVEFEAPLLKDLPLVQSLSLNGAARYTAYETSGNYWTWKVGGDWHLTDSLRFRATRSRDIRAPTLYELYAPVNSVPVSPVDLLTGLSVSAPSTDQSNRNLTAELADTTTGGVVWRPTFVSGLSIALDLYKITINDAVVLAAGSTPAYQQLCYASGGSSEWCALQKRALNNYTDKSAANFVTAWFTLQKNFAQIETTGADLEINYSTDVFDRPVNLRLITAYQPHAYYRQLGAPTVDQGNVAFGPTGLSAAPGVRVAGFARVGLNKDWTLDVLQRWRSAEKLGGNPTEVWANNHLDAFGTTDVTFTWKVPDSEWGNTLLSFTINNILDNDPPGGGYSGNGTRAGLRDGFSLGDDVQGRAFSMGVRIKR